MGPYWLPLVCLCALATSVRSAAVPTQETLVVAKDDQATTTLGSVSSGPVEPTTEGPLPPLKLTEMDVKSEVSLRYAHTAVVTKVKNPANRAQEATFRVLLPETAFISGFTMILDGKPYKAYVKEKEEAKQIYNDAVTQGFGAAHIAAKARDSNHFTVSVNVEPSTTAVFNLTYEELLTRRNNVYNHEINLHPGVEVPKMTITVHIKEAQKITTLRVPEVRTGNEIDASETDAQNPKAVIDRGHDDREATITFTPDIQEQRRLMEIYAEKSQESQKQHQQHDTYGWHPDSGNEKPITGVLGQFVVQYDVDRPKEGEILVNDGYFVHFFAPTGLPPLAKHVVFVLDTSGSMSGHKINQLQQAMHTILSELNPGDYFSIVEFASSVTVHDLKEASEEPKRKEYVYYAWDHEQPATLLPPYPATKDNIEKAKVIVSRMTADGGTNIASALNVAVDLVNKGVDWKPDPSITTSKPTNKGEPEIEEKVDDGNRPEAMELRADTSQATSTSSTTEVAKTSKGNLLTTIKPTNKGEPEIEEKVDDGDRPEAMELRADTSQATSTSSTTEVAKTSKDKKKLEPIIIFLTDGDPTVGDTNPTHIINRISEKNSGVNKASIFSLAFGEDADRKFLRKLSLRNEGFMRHIYEAADAALQLHDFYRQVSSPLLADVKFIYPSDQVKKDSLTKHDFRTFYAGGETVVAGRVADDAAEISPQIIAICGVDDSFTKKKYEINPKVPVARGKGQYLPLERMWAYITIKQLLDQKDAADQVADKDKEDTPEKKALSLALKYEFVTPLTSLVVVKPNATKAVDAESVDKPNDSGNYPGSFAPSGLIAQQLSSSAQVAGGLQAQSGSPALYRPMVFSDPVAFEDPVDSEDLPVESSADSEKAAFAALPGPPGMAGFPGSSGYSGYPGSSGYSSFPGSSGFSGFPGSSASRYSGQQGQAGGYSSSSGSRGSLFSYAARPYYTFGGTPGANSPAGLQAQGFSYRPASIYRPVLQPIATNGVYPTTPLDIGDRIVIGTTTVATTESPLKAYHLENLPWLAELLKSYNNGTLSFSVKKTGEADTYVELDLSESETAPKDADGDKKCSPATDNAEGVCVYLSRCTTAVNMTAATYPQFHCKVDNKYAGICCPSAMIDVKSN